MFRHLLPLVVFLLGLAAVCWIGVSYAGSNPLGAAVAALIGACYLAGALELYRYRQATATLAQALDGTADAPPGLDDWLLRLAPGLRPAVRRRIEGERAALPAPALAPYLVGLLVLLGMLGTLLGMMATLRGTGLALESATDLQAIRGSLAAPVKGLGFAFGTSIAGVASSAMLGLLAALCRRERQQAVQRLDAMIASTLRVHSQAHRREEAFRLLQRQTEAMPVLVDRLQAMMDTLERQNLAAGERQAAAQEAFHARTEAAYARLGAVMEQSLGSGIAESVRAAGSTLQPLVEAAMAGLARETAALHDGIGQAVRRQLDALASGFESASQNVAGIWNEALAAHRQSSETLARELHDTLQHAAETADRRTSALLDTVAARLDASAENVAGAWNQALSKQQAANEDMAVRNQQALAAAAAGFEQHAAALVRTVQQSHSELQDALASRDRERLAAWTDTLGATAAALDAQWRQAGEATAARQQAICDTLARTADEVAAQTRAHASDTLAEIARLVQAASEAPKAAAEVVAEMRQKLSDSMVRDTAMLEERNRLLATLETLLDAVNHASTEQRQAVDALVAGSADLLERVGSRFTDRIEAETGKLDDAAAQVAAGAVEVAGLGDAFAAAVQSFGQSNEALMERLQRIADALDASLARSDEQLAYYVAQAREVVELSVLSQKQIIEDLQRHAGQPANAADETA